MATAPYSYVSTSTLRAGGDDEGGSLYEEMMKRQQLLRNFETYVHEKDAADSAEKTREALLHVTGKSESCTPLITGGLCMGITPPMTQIRKARAVRRSSQGASAWGSHRR